MDNEIQITMKKEAEKNSTVILAFPDVGLVGPIAVKQILEELEMQELGYIDSDEFPPITAVHKARPTYPVRIYGKNNLVVVTSEIPLSLNLINPLSESLSEWLKDIQAKKAIILGGLSHQNRMEIEEPEVHGVPSDGNMESLLEENDIHVLQEGFVAGINGILLRDLMESELPGIYLMADSHQNYPDPGAAASVLEALNNLEGLDVNVEELWKKEEEIRVGARDLMRQTQKAMQKTAKDQEGEMPIMYG